MTPNTTHNHSLTIPDPLVEKTIVGMEADTMPIYRPTIPRKERNLFQP
jgi:hypothetical protein